MPPASHRPNQAVSRRDAGLRKVSIATRALVVGSVTAASAFAALAAWAQPGRSKPSSTAGAQNTPVASIGTSPTANAPSTTPATVAPAGGDDDLAPPATVPSTQDPGVQYTPPTYQYTPPTYQYSPPVVSSAT
jgi:hypothetical protein